MFSTATSMEKPAGVPGVEALALPSVEALAAAARRPSSWAQTVEELA